MNCVSLPSAPHAYTWLGESAPGPTLVFVHGWMLSRHYWHPLCAQLAAYHPCLTYDLRGFGESPLGEGRRFDTRSYAEDLVALLTALRLDSVWLVGHSLGGSIALAAAAIAPDQVKGVIGVNAGGGIYLEAEFERFRQIGVQIIRFRPSWLARLPGLAWYFCRDSVYQPLAAQWGQQRVQDFVAAQPLAARGALLETTTEAEVHHLPQLVSQLPQPVHFLAGEKDTIMEPRYVHHLASFHPLYRQGGNVTELPNCGHLAMVEQTDLVAAEITRIVACPWP